MSRLRVPGLRKVLQKLSPRKPTEVKSLSVELVGKVQLNSRDRKPYYGNAKKLGMRKKSNWIVCSFSQGCSPKLGAFTSEFSLRPFRFLKEPFYAKSLQLLTNEQLTTYKQFEFSFGFDQSSPNILSRGLLTIFCSSSDGLVWRSLIQSTYYGNFINVRWFLIVQLIENSVFSSPKIFKTELILRFLQITEKPVQKMIQETFPNSSSGIHGPGISGHFRCISDALQTVFKPIKSKLIECYYQCDNIQCSIREPFIGQINIQKKTEALESIYLQLMRKETLRSGP